MVTTTIDPIRVPTLNLSPAEIEEIQELMEAGQLPGDFLDRHYEAVRTNVFGEGYKIDRHGEPIEQGIGSSGNQTRNSIDAYRKWCNPDNPKATDPDPNYRENLARMETELKACEEIRKKVRVARAKKSKRKAP